MSTSERSPDEVARLLAQEFGPGAVKFRPGTVSGNRALALAYVDARVVQDRLDDVLGVMGWQDSYECLADGAVVCRLRIKVAGEWICKEDVGGQSEQPDEGDRRKAAFSDALKRAAVKFGIGRYLYRLKAQWLDHDVAKRRFVKEPVLTPSAPTAVKPAPPIPAKKEPPRPLTTEEQQEIEGWKDWLGGRPDLAAFNDTVKTDLPGLPERVKQEVWQLVCAYAQERNWTIDRQKKAFVEAQAA